MKVLAGLTFVGDGVGGDMDSTLVTKSKVHVVRVANHVNPKLQTIQLPTMTTTVPN